MEENKQKASKREFGKGKGLFSFLARWSYYLLWVIAAYLILLTLFSAYYSFPYGGNDP
jgi:hypothetical protein